VAEQSEERRRRNKIIQDEMARTKALGGDRDTTHRVRGLDTELLRKERQRLQQRDATATDGSGGDGDAKGEAVAEGGAGTPLGAHVAQFIATALQRWRGARAPTAANDGTAITKLYVYNLGGHSRLPTAQESVASNCPQAGVKDKPIQVAAPAEELLQRIGAIRQGRGKAAAAEVDGHDAKREEGAQEVSIFDDCGTFDPDELSD
jgi:hypothetical protein